jgi:F-type H+-transporting ATPase subunit a
MNIRNFFEVMAESVYGMVEGAMGSHNARAVLPAGRHAVAVHPVRQPDRPGPRASSRPTTRSRPTSPWPARCSSLTHVYGVKEHGLAYFKHFLGPTPALAPLMLPIEIVSHIARPISLTLRLMGNMVADHKVVFSFFMLVPILVPMPFMLLGLLVCLVQAIVFCTLTMVYLSMAVEHEEH